MGGSSKGSHPLAPWSESGIYRHDLPGSLGSKWRKRERPGRYERLLTQRPFLFRHRVARTLCEHHPARVPTPSFVTDLEASCSTPPNPEGPARGPSVLHSFPMTDPYLHDDGRRRLAMRAHPSRIFLKPRRQRTPHAVDALVGFPAFTQRRPCPRQRGARPWTPTMLSTRRFVDDTRWR